MGTRNRAFVAENGGSSHDIDEIPSISKNTNMDGAQMTKFVSQMRFNFRDLVA